jgi:hypothetical protein
MINPRRKHAGRVQVQRHALRPAVQLPVNHPEAELGPIHFFFDTNRAVEDVTNLFVPNGVYFTEGWKH